MALYNFTDTSKYNPGMNIPGEAVSIGGVVLENEIDGYRTLFVKGRESLSAEIKSTERGADGSVYHGKRYPERVITVGFQMLAKTDADYRNKFNKLAQLLNVEQAEIIFNDEPDKYFIGTPGEVGEIEPGRNKVTGEFQIVCADPFKYSVDLKEVTSWLSYGSVRTGTIYYNGSIPADYIIEGKAGTGANIRWLTFSTNDNRVALGDLNASTSSEYYAVLEQDLSPGELSVTTYEDTFDNVEYSAYRYIAMLDAPDAKKSSTYDIRMQTTSSNTMYQTDTIRIIKDYAGLRVRIAHGSNLLGEYYANSDDFFPATVSIFDTGSKIMYRVNNIIASVDVAAPRAGSCSLQLLSKSDITLNCPLLRFFGDHVYGGPTDTSNLNYMTVSNKFIDGDTIKIDTARKAVYVDGIPRPDLNYLSNLWNVQLQPGQNAVLANSTGGTITDFVLKYRERWL